MTVQALGSEKTCFFYFSLTSFLEPVSALLTFFISVTFYYFVLLIKKILMVLNIEYYIVLYVY